MYAVGANGTILYSPGNGDWGTIPSGSSSNLEAVYGLNGEIWAVGNWTILSGNASGFSVAETFSSDYLYGVWVSPDDEVFAVGWAGLMLGESPDGFEKITTSSAEVLESVMGISGDDFFAVGRGGVLLRYRAEMGQ